MNGIIVFVGLLLVCNIARRCGSRNTKQEHALRVRPGGKAINEQEKRAFLDQIEDADARAHYKAQLEAAEDWEGVATGGIFAPPGQDGVFSAGAHPRPMENTVVQTAFLEWNDSPPVAPPVTSSPPKDELRSLAADLDRIVSTTPPKEQEPVFASDQPAPRSRYDRAWSVFWMVVVVLLLLVYLFAALGILPGW